MGNPESLETTLRNWMRLNKDIMKLSEESLVQLLELEKTGRARLRVLLRIYNRLSKVRSIREKAELGAIARG